MKLKRLIVWFFAFISGFYLLVLGWIPDPIPFLDEATALLVLVKSLDYLGYDIRRFIPFMSKGAKPPPARNARNQTVDV